MATTVSYGTVSSSTTNGGSITPAIPGSPSSTSILLCLLWNRSSPTATPFTKSGARAAYWTKIWDSYSDGATSAPSCSAFVADGTETVDPTFDWPGTANPVCAVIIRCSGVLVADVVGKIGTNFAAGGSADDYTVGPIPAATPLKSSTGIVFSFAIHRNTGDSACTNSSISSNSSLTWTKGKEHFTTVGSDVSFAIFHSIYTSAPTLSAETVTFSGGTAAGGQYGRMFEIKSGITGDYAAADDPFAASYSGAATVTGSYAVAWDAIAGSYSGAVSISGASTAPWAEFSGPYVGTVSIAGGYDAAWPDFSAALSGGQIVTGNYSESWPTFAAAYAGNAIAGGAYQTAWPAFGGDYSGTVSIAGRVIGAWGPFAGDYDGAVSVAGALKPAAWLPFGGIYSGNAPVAGNYAALWEWFTGQYSSRVVVVAIKPPIDVEDDSAVDLRWALNDDDDDGFVSADLALNNSGCPAWSGDLISDIIMSLGTDARAGPTDIIPDGTSDRRGHWGDIYPANGLAADTFGSLLWLLEREKQVPATLVRARDYARRALQWMVDDGIAESIDVDASFPRTAWLLIEGTVYRPAAPPVRFKFAITWAATAAALGSA